MTRSGEESLALAKIGVMLELIGGRYRETVKKNQHVAMKDEAYRWFFGRSDFEAWCDTAGYDPGYVRAKARELYEKGLPDSPMKRVRRDR